MIFFYLFTSIRTTLSRILSNLHTYIVKHSLDVTIGDKSLIYWKTPIDIRNGCKLHIGFNSEIGRTKLGYHCGMPFPTTLLLDGNNSIITIGNNCRINGGYIHAKKEIRIGDNCVIAGGVNIIDSNGHIVNSKNRTVGRDIPKEIIIGNNVWIGMNSTILKGTVIGDNCVVSAGSIVKGDFPENCVISGNLAQIIGNVEII